MTDTQTESNSVLFKFVSVTHFCFTFQIFYPDQGKYVEFFNPKIRRELEKKDEEFKRAYGYKGAAPGGDEWVWLTSYCRIPVRVLPNVWFIINLIWINFFCSTNRLLAFAVPQRNTVRREFREFLVYQVPKVTLFWSHKLTFLCFYFICPTSVYFSSDFLYLSRGCGKPCKWRLFLLNFNKDENSIK